MKKNKKAEEKKEPEEKKSKLPSWFNENIVTPFKAGISHTFLLHGEINDLIPNPESEDGSEEPYISLKKLLSKVFKNRKMVIFYNIASGLSFPQSEMKDEFKKSVGLESEDADPKDPIAAAKAGLAAKRNMPRDPDTCLMLIEKVLKKLPSTVVIINSIHFIAPKGGGGVELLPNERANVERIKNWSQEEGLRSNDSIIFLLTDQSAKVSSELKQGGSQIHIALITKPGKKERKEFIGSVVRKGGDAVDTEDKFAFAVPKNFDLDEFTNMTQGLSLRQILEIFLQYKKTDKPIDPNYIKEKKREILNAEYGDVMEIVNPERGLEDIGGLEYAKDFFQEIIKAIQKGESRLVSMGVTLSGPPGTGKTALVEALAYEAKFEFVKVKNVRSMWLGESEANMERLVSGLRSLAPVVVMNDEADLANAERDAPKGDAGASERIMKMWMELLSDPKIRGQVIVISCTNRPDRIDPALKRSGRSDERLLIPMPSRGELPVIFKVMFKRHKIVTNIKDFTAFAEMVDGFSGADVEKIVLNSFRFAFQKNKKEVDEKTLTEAVEDFIPSASQAEIDRMTLLGLSECSSRRLLPPNTKEIVAKIKSRRLVENMDAILEEIKTRKITEVD